MKYFTPELYIRFNSDDADIAEKADEEWESAIREYDKRLNVFRESLRPQAKQLLQICLHDAELVGFKQALPNVAIFALVQDDQQIFLTYFMARDLTVTTRPSKWPFSKKQVYWLYDEVDVDTRREGVFVHRILFSDGRVYVIPFFDLVVFSRFTKARKREKARQKPTASHSV